MRRRTIYSSNGKIPNLNAGISLDKSVGEKLNEILRLRKSLKSLESKTIFEKTLTALESKIIIQKAIFHNFIYCCAKGK